MKTKNGLIVSQPRSQGLFPLPPLSLEDRRIDDVIIKTFALCFLKMAESFENLADWENEDLEKSLAEAVDSYDKQEEEKKNTFLC